MLSILGSTSTKTPITSHGTSIVLNSDAILVEPTKKTTLDESTLEELVDGPEWMQLRGCDYMDEPEWMPYSNVQKEDPFAISIGPIMISRSKKLIEKIACLVQNQESEGELLDQTTTTPTTFIYSVVSYNI